ncbi:Nucleotidyltransferase, partial [Polyplosphaeria fusca]
RKPSLPGPRSVKPNLRLERLKWINDYKGVSVLPLLAPKKPKETEVPWHISMREREGKDQNEILSQEICSFHDYIRPSPLETVARKTTVKRVKNSVRAVLPDMDLEVFGSERTGLAFALSDLDLRLVADDEQTATGLPSRNVRNRLNGHLKTLERELRKQTTSYSLVAHRHARYPLVAMQHRSTGLDVQIVLSNDTAQSRDYMNRSMKEFPYLSQLYSVVKTMFDMRGLSDVFRGGFGSYSIFMMIVASLRHSPSIPSDVGQALLHFLEFWERFDTTSKGISIEPAELYDKASTQVISRTAKIKLEENKTQPPNFMLSLRDPADPTNDLGRKGFCIKHVQATCAFLLLDLRQRLEKQHTESFLASIVACIYPLQLASRRRLEAIGLTVERSRL